jgi:hypothetical protein
MGAISALSQMDQEKERNTYRIENEENPHGKD